jgi:hypothetical protein
MDDPQIDEATRNAVTNASAEGEWHFRARF